jgi:hypothetical protein
MCGPVLVLPKTGPAMEFSAQDVRVNSRLQWDMLSKGPTKSADGFLGTHSLYATPP